MTAPAPRAVMEGEPLILVPCLKPWTCRGCYSTLEAGSLHYRQPGRASDARRWCVACVKSARRGKHSPDVRRGLTGLWAWTA